MDPDIPKPWFRCWDTPVLDYQIESLRRSGGKDVTIVVGHLGEQIKAHFAAGAA